MNGHVIEAQIRYRTTEEGGRKAGVASGYRGQFHYDGDDFDGFQYFPEPELSSLVPLGREVRAYVWFPLERWERVHKHTLRIGKAFQIREGARVVGDGYVTRVDVPATEWNDLVR